MFSEIKSKLKNLLNNKSEPTLDDNNIASNAILDIFVEAALIDGEISNDEKEKILFFLKNKFKYSSEEAEENLQNAISKATDQIEIWSKTKSIRDDMNYEERLEIIEMIWQIVIADDKIDDYESQLMRRLAGLLYIEDKDSGIAKKRAMESHFNK